MTSSAKKIIERFETRRAERSALDQLWEEIAEVLSPERIGFTSKTVNNQSVRRTTKIYDTTPILAKRGLVNALGSMMRPKSSAPGKWFDIVPENEDLMSNRAVKEWVDFAEGRMWKALYNPKARFIQVTGECDDDLITFGTGAGFVGTNKDEDGLLFRSFHLAGVYLDADDQNEISGVFLLEKLTPIQAAERWGKENLGRKTLEAMENPRPDETKKFDFIWCVKNRNAFDPRYGGARNMPIESIVVDKDSEHIVEEGGYEEFPFFLPRWDTRSMELYGRGPGVLALPSVLTLNQMGKTMLRGLHRAVAPPWLLPADSTVNAPQLVPDGVTYYDAKAVRNIGLSNPFIQMESRGNIPWGLNAQEAEREQIHGLFFRNVLNLPIDSPQMTATEINARREEFIREVGGVFGKLENSYTQPIIERVFNIMMRRGAFGDVTEIPEELQGQSITFRFASPVEKAKRQIEEQMISESVNKVLTIGQVQPSVMTPYNWEEIGKYIAESNDFPTKLTYSNEELEQVKEAQAQQQQQEQAMQMMERGAGMIGQLPAGAMEGGGGGEQIEEAIPA